MIPGTLGGGLADDFVGYGGGGVGQVEGADVVGEHGEEIKLVFVLGEEVLGEAHGFGAEDEEAVCFVVGLEIIVLGQLGEEEELILSGVELLHEIREIFVD